MSEILTRAASFEPSTFDAERNTVEVVFSTGAPVTRRDFAGEYQERLELSPEAVDVAALRGAPVLNHHDRFSGVEAILGIVEDAAVDGQRGMARLRFGQRPEIQGIVADIRGGVIPGVSVGYQVQEWRESKENGARVRTAVKWKPVEISFTPLPADAGAKTRSKGEPMELHTQIRNLAETLGVRAEFAEDLIQRNVNEGDARAALIREAARSIPAIDSRAPAVSTREQSPMDRARAAGEALYLRVNPAHQLSDQARPFAGRRIADLYREELRQRGLNALGSDAEIVSRAMHTVSDFASGIFAELFNKNLLTLRAAPPNITRIFKRATVDDFRERHVFEITDGPALVKVNETGEIKSGTIQDKKLSSYKVDSYARMFSLSFQAQVNDDVAALTDLSAKMTRGARSWFTGFLVDALIANPKLADNKAVFHADHGNLATFGGAPIEESIMAAKLAMRLQADASGNPIDAGPEMIVFPATHEGAVDKLLAKLYPTQPADAVVAARNLSPVVIPHLDAKGETEAWYLFASTAAAPVFEYSELSGYEGPQVEVRQGFDTLGLDIRVVWHVGAGAIDHRGAFKCPGGSGG